VSMNYFFAAFEQEDIDAMSGDHSLIDQYVFETETPLLSTDVGTAWDVLVNILNGTGFHAGDFFDDALTNGGFLLSATEAKEQAIRLSQWKRETLIERLQEIEADSELYWLDVYKDDEDMLLEEFDKLVAFYTRAAEKSLGVVHYPA